MELVGLEKLKDQMSKIESRGDAYRKGKAQLPHIVMNLTHDNGQSTTADYITTVFHENTLRKFCGLDHLLEYSLDGSLLQIKQVFEDIDSNAVYTNEYEGVVAVDISALSEVANEFQTDYFIEHIREVAKNATVIIYYDDSLGRKMQLVKDRVVQAIGNFVDVPVAPYSRKEYARIVIQDIRQRGIEIDEEEDLEKILCRAFEACPVNSAKEAVAVAQELVFCADYSGLTPRMDAKSVGELLGSSRTCI